MLKPTVSVIVLTMGNRPRELDALIASFDDQQPFDGVLIGNGVEPPAYSGWRSMALDDNIGISAGRAYGATSSDGDLLAFIDDDAKNLTPTLLADVQSVFAADPALGAIALRVVVEGTDRSPSEWQPRIRGRGQHTTGDVTWFPGGAHVILASVYAAVGGYSDNFWYSHEETDLAWRILDAGYRITYRPDLTLSHPETQPSRHNKHLWFSARNRIWLARKHLPVAMAGIYVAVWLGIQLVRCRALADVKGVLDGTWAGLRESPGYRRPMSWRTVWTMTRLGRPPLI